MKKKIKLNGQIVGQSSSSLLNNKKRSIIKSKYWTTKKIERENFHAWIIFWIVIILCLDVICVWVYFINSISIQFSLIDLIIDCVCVYIVLWKIQSDLNFSKKKINIIKCFGQSSLFEIAPFNSEKNVRLVFVLLFHFSFASSFFNLYNHHLLDWIEGRK